MHSSQRLGAILTFVIIIIILLTWALQARGQGDDSKDAFVEDNHALPGTEGAMSRISMPSPEDGAAGGNKTSISKLFDNVLDKFAVANNVCPISDRPTAFDESVDIHTLNHNVNGTRATPTASMAELDNATWPDKSDWYDA